MFDICLMEKISKLCWKSVIMEKSSKILDCTVSSNWVSFSDLKIDVESAKQFEDSMLFINIQLIKNYCKNKYLITLISVTK